LAGRFTLLRLSATDESAELLVSLISEDELPFKVLLGASLERETATPDAPGTPRPEAAAANQAQVQAALQLASAYPDVVLALVLGSPPQGSGSSRRLPQETLVSWLRRARSGTKIPVSTAGDAAYWLSPEGGQLAREVDFLVLHASALWSGKQIPEALAFTQARYADVFRRHFGLPVVLGEAGWATSRHAGEEAERIQGEIGEGPQKVFFDQLTRWVVGQRIPSAWFQAFDEPWRGGADPDEVAKHWGLWRADRTPKAAVEKTPTVAPGAL
jgi:exo-beta-1,3-glucanase (GH17 family)